MPPTIYDVAEQAGVSTATVSRVYNNAERVSEPTRLRVLQAAKKLRYRPHISARNLAMKKSRLLSAVIPVLTNAFYMEVIRGMQNEIHQSDFDLLVFAAPRPEEIDDQLYRALQPGRSDGLLLLSTVPTDEQEALIKSVYSSVVLTDALHPEFDSIAVDNRQGGYLATMHLIEQGYRDIAHITVAAPKPPQASERLAGYKQALRDAGLPVRPELIVASQKHLYGFVEEAGYEGMKTLMEGSVHPEAVFAASDVQALGALDYLRTKQLRVPEDIAMIGFDDIRVSSYVGLSTLRQPMQVMGRYAVKRVLERLEQPDLPVDQVQMTPELVVRNTCGAKNSLRKSAAG